MTADVHIGDDLGRVAHDESVAALVARFRGQSHAQNAGWMDIALDVSSDIRALEPVWREFEAHADGTVFQSYDWLSCWQQHIGALTAAVPAIVTGRDASGALVFLLPFAIERQGFIRRLTWLGVDLCDYTGPLLAGDFTRRFGERSFPALWDRILASVRTTAGLRFDYVDLPKMLERVGTQPNPFFTLPTRANPSGAWVATLGAEWEAYYAATRSGPTRKKERKQLKQLGEHGEVVFAEASEPEAVREVVEKLLDYKSAAFHRMGVTDSMAQPGYRAFYRDFTTRLSARQVAHITHLDIGGKVVAASLGLRHRGDYCLVLSSYENGALARLGPGRAHLNDLIRYAVEHGFRRFDFTIGDEPYKRDWADVTVLPRDHLAQASVVGSAIVFSRLGFLTLKRFIKQTPALWSAFLKLRSLKARLTGGAGKSAAPQPVDAE
jgi:CelD/BcsL family acetyltransferase involved in cellulose biosynthesis